MWQLTLIVISSGTLIIILVIMTILKILHQAYKELGLLMVLLFVCILTFARFQSLSLESSLSSIAFSASSPMLSSNNCFHIYKKKIIFPLRPPPPPPHFPCQSNFKPHLLVHFLSLIYFHFSSLIYFHFSSLIYFAEKDSISKWSFTDSFWWAC